jgi:hypothetical protein
MCIANSDFIAVVEFFSYRAGTYLRIAKIVSIFTKTLLFALDKNYFTHAFFNFTNIGYFTR